MEPDAISAPQLAMEDLGAAIGLLEFAHKQGVFTDWTMLEQMVCVRNRLSNFLNFLNAMDAAKNRATEAAAESELISEIPKNPDIRNAAARRDDSIHPNRY